MKLFASKHRHPLNASEKGKELRLLAESVLDDGPSFLLSGR